MANKKSNSGRKTVMTDAVIKKLEEGFMYDLNIGEACLFAGISRRTFENYVNKKPKMKEHFEMLRENVRMKAKINIANKIKRGDIDTSKWELEHRAPEEYSKKVNAGINENITIEFSSELGGLGE